MLWEIDCHQQPPPMVLVTHVRCGLKCKHGHSVQAEKVLIKYDLKGSWVNRSTNRSVRDAAAASRCCCSLSCPACDPVWDD